jgi:hypothetical protein
MARPKQRRRKCLCCRAWFIADPRKRGQQQYCSKERCRKASKTASQRRWLCKSENEGYFRGPEHVDRVQRWRRDHPGYWRRTSAPARAALQDLIDTQPIETVGQTGDIGGALQDVMAVRSRWRVQRSAAQASRSGVSLSTTCRSAPPGRLGIPARHLVLK